MEKQRKKLPIARTIFREIRDPKENFAYIDKTMFAHKMITEDKYYFLSRPRRFGKSLFVDTLAEIFKGNKKLFEGLFIYDRWDWNQKFPVVNLDFTGGELSSEKRIRYKIREVVLRATQIHEIDFTPIESEDVGIMLERLVIALHKKYGQQVVVLIDEYDKPILDNIALDDKKVALEARSILKGFYSALKLVDRHIRFVFITGVSKFSKLNLFSGLNNLTDLTVRQDFATITGYTHNDILEVFSGYLEGVNMDEVKGWYNGYNYLGDPVYNPYDILLFLSNQCEFRNYWWQTGNPSFLIEKLKEDNYFIPDLLNATVGEETLNAFDVEHIDLTALLWQTGYLTFDKKLVGRRIKYSLKIPNQEIQNSLNFLMFDYLTGLKDRVIKNQDTVYDAIESGDFESFEKNLKAMFASIPYENYVKNNIADFEGYYASVMYAFFASIGLEVRAEESTNRARVDMTLIAPESIFIMEFKVDMPAEKALHQIETRKYYEKYTSLGKDIFLIGIHFSSEERNIVGMEWKKFDVA